MATTPLRVRRGGDPIATTVPLVGSTPIPDPTVLTSELVEKAISALEATLQARIEAIWQRIDSVDKTITALSLVSKDAREQHLNLVVEKINANAMLRDEKFHSIDRRLELNDTQAEKAARDIKTALDAAFNAVSDQNRSNAVSITKSEAGFTKQIDQLADTIKSTTNNTDGKITDLKDRIVIIESRTSISDPTTNAALRDMASAITQLRQHADSGSGGKEASQNYTTLIFSIIAAIAAIGTTIALIVTLAHRVN